MLFELLTVSLPDTVRLAMFPFPWQSRTWMGATPNSPDCSASASGPMVHPSAPVEPDHEPSIPTATINPGLRPWTVIDDNELVGYKMDTPSRPLSGLFTDPFLSGLFGLCLHVRCIPQQNSQWQFWASVCACVCVCVLSKRPVWPVATLPRFLLFHSSCILHRRSRYHVSLRWVHQAASRHWMQSPTRRIATSSTVSKETCLTRSTPFSIVSCKKQIKATSNPCVCFVPVTLERPLPMTPSVRRRSLLSWVLSRVLTKSNFLQAGLTTCSWLNWLLLSKEVGKQSSESRKTGTGIAIQYIT